MEGFASDANNLGQNYNYIGNELLGFFFATSGVICISHHGTCPKALHVKQPHGLGGNMVLDKSGRVTRVHAACLCK